MRIADGNDGQQADRRTRPGAREELRRQGTGKVVSGKLARIRRVGSGECHTRRSKPSNAHRATPPVWPASVLDVPMNMVLQAVPQKGSLSFDRIAKSIGQK
jgi:hypothetical protein